MNLVLSLFNLGVLFRKLCTFYKIKTTSAPQYLFDLIPQTYHQYNTCATEDVITFYSRIDAFKYSFSQYTVNPLCPCSLEIECPLDFFLHCHYFTDIFNEKLSVNENTFNQSDNEIVELLL